ncbi:MAG: hypothetical protein PHI97_35090 [Desulfobulbus sp.]|nr:hypothetical protein [Desulfobulbus sp.]
MKILIYTTILNLFFADYFAFKLHVIPRWVTWLPEAASLLILIYFFSSITIKKQLNVNIKYIFCIIIFVFFIFSGFILNQVSAGVMFSGIRIYFRYIPFFLLPIVWNVSEKELNNLLIFIFSLSLMQLPFVLYQRFIQYSNSLTGDPMGGSLGTNTSGVLSVFLLLVLAFYIACYLNGKINFFVFCLGAAILVLPTSMNETKITFALLPTCFILPLIFRVVDKDKIQRIIALFLFAGVAFICLKTIYDFFIVKRWGYGIGEFAQMEGRLQGYADSRIVPIIKTFERLIDDPIFFFFGIGAGNASVSFSTQMTGEYVPLLASIGIDRLGITTLIWELGIAGISGVILFLAFVFIDTLKLCKTQCGLRKTLGIAMVSIIPIYVATSAYFNVTQILIINVPFWLLCGFVAKYSYITNDTRKTFAAH